MATRQQALQITLQALNDISKAVQQGFNSWQTNIKIKPVIIVAPIRAAIQVVIRDISSIRSDLGRTDPIANALLGLIVDKLTEYSDVLTMKVFGKPAELLTAWSKTLDNLLGDIAASVPEAKQIKMFKSLKAA